MVCIRPSNLHQGTSLGLAISAFVVGAALVVGIVLLWGLASIGA
jgi:hypothetical protein